MNPFPGALLLDPKGQRKLARQQQQQQQKRQNQTPNQGQGQGYRGSDSVVANVTGDRQGVSQGARTPRRSTPAAQFVFQNNEATPSSVTEASSLSSRDGSSNTNTEEGEGFSSNGGRDVPEQGTSVTEDANSEKAAHGNSEALSMVESIYNVSERWGGAAKRQKLDDGRSSSSFKRRETGVPPTLLQNPMGGGTLPPPPPATIDLTAGN